MRIRLYELAGELGVESRELLRHARVLGLDVTSPLAGVATDDADQLRAVVRIPPPTTIRAYELARELGIESRDILELAITIGLDASSSFAEIPSDGADQIRAIVRNPPPTTIRTYELARELGVESRDILERARILEIDVTSPLGSISLDDADRIGALADLAELAQTRRAMLAAGTERLLAHLSRTDVPPVSAEIDTAGDTGDIAVPVDRGAVSVGPDNLRAAPPPASSDVDARFSPADLATSEVPHHLVEAPSDDGDLQASAAAPPVGSSDPQPRSAHATGSAESSELHPSRQPFAVESDLQTLNPGTDRNVAAGSRQQDHRRRAMAPGAPRQSAPVVPNAPGHHLPSGRFHVAYLLLLATIFTIPFELAFQIPGLGTLAKALGFATFTAWFLGVLVSGRMRTPELFHYLFFALGIWISLSLYWSLDTSATAGRIVTFLLLFALVLVIWDLCDTPAAINAALQAYVLGTWIAAISVYVNFAQNNQVKYGRFAADGAADPNVTSLFLAIGLPIAWYLFLNAERRPARWINLAYVPAGVLAMALSGSRGGFIAGSVALVYVAITFPRKKPVAFVSALLVLIGAVAVVVTLVPAESFERIGTVDDSIASGDLNGRTEIWQRAWDVYIDYPLLGTGAGSTRKVLGLDKVGHNVFVTAGLETGVIGVVLFGAILVVVFQKALSMDRADRRMWLTVLIMWSIGSMSLDLATKKVTWLLFGLLVAAAATVAATTSPETQGATADPRPAAGATSGRR